MKYLIISGVFVIGLSLGYVIGTQTGANQEQQNFIANTDQINDGENLVDENTEDVNHHAENSGHDKNDADTLTFDDQDSVFVDINIVDTLSDGDLSIRREKMIKSVKLPIVFLGEEIVAKDTIIKELLGIEDVVAKSLFVEFWESPLNFEGYKLSKKKLIVYGLSPQFNYKIYRNHDNYYFAYQNVYYRMKETQDFLPFLEVSKSEVFND